MIKNSSIVPAVLLLPACLLLSGCSASGTLFTVFLIIVLLIAVPMLIFNIYSNRAAYRGQKPNYPTYRSSDGRHSRPRPEKGDTDPDEQVPVGNDPRRRTVRRTRIYPYHVPYYGGVRPCVHGPASHSSSGSAGGNDGRVFGGGSSRGAGAGGRGSSGGRSFGGGSTRGAGAGGRGSSGGRSFGGGSSRGAGAGGRK